MSARSWVNQLLTPGAVRMIAVDLPGHGESDPPPGVSVEEYAAVVAEFLFALECGPVVVIGHSLGGAVAIALAARHPALVRGLVLIASYVKLPLVDSVGERLVAYLPGPLRRLVFFSMVKKVLFAPQAPADAIEVAMRDLRACRPETIMSDVRAARAMDLTEQAAALDVPTLALAGGRDRLTTPAAGRAAERADPEFTAPARRRRRAHASHGSSRVGESRDRDIRRVARRAVAVIRDNRHASPFARSPCARLAHAPGAATRIVNTALT